MTREKRQFATLMLGGLGLFSAVVFDLHRHAIAAVWPYLMAFMEWQAI